MARFGSTIFLIQPRDTIKLWALGPLCKYSLGVIIGGSGAGDFESSSFANLKTLRRNIMKITMNLALLATTIVFCGLISANAYAIPPQCTEASDSYSQYLYKSSNAHGGRGMSLIINTCRKISASLRPNKRTIQLLAENGTRIGQYGQFGPSEGPYGRRFYSIVPGGSRHSASSLAARALRFGGSRKVYALIRSPVGKCFIIKDPRNARQTKTFNPVPSKLKKPCA